MNSKSETLESFLISKERVLMDVCVRSQFIVSETDVLAKHYSLIDAAIQDHDDFIVSTEWRIKNTLRDRFDLVVVKKWVKPYAHRKQCFADNLPYYAAEYKVDDEQGRYGKAEQIEAFKKDVIRLAKNCHYLHRAFALYYYRGPKAIEDSLLDSNSSKYVFRDTDDTIVKQKLHVYVVDRLGVHRLDFS